MIIVGTQSQLRINFGIGVSPSDIILAYLDPVTCLNEIPSSVACEGLDSNVHIFRNKAGELSSWAWVFATIQSKKFVTTVDMPLEEDEHDDWKVVS